MELIDNFQEALWKKGDPDDLEGYTRYRIMKCESDDKSPGVFMYGIFDDEGRMKKVRIEGGLGTRDPLAGIANLFVKLALDDRMVDGVIVEDECVLRRQEGEGAEEEGRQGEGEQGTDEGSGSGQENQAEENQAEENQAEENQAEENQAGEPAQAAEEPKVEETGLNHHDKADDVTTTNETKAHVNAICPEVKESSTARRKYSREERQPLRSHNYNQDNIGEHDCHSIKSRVIAPPADRKHVNHHTDTSDVSCPKATAVAPPPAENNATDEAEMEEGECEEPASTETTATDATTIFHCTQVVATPNQEHVTWVCVE